MQLSSSCLYHYTPSKDALLAILKDNFKGSYCREYLKYKDEVINAFIPMISFCDIPLKTYSNLGAIYGKYGLGMSRKWAVRNKLNPVFYIDNNAALLDVFIKSLKAAEGTTAIAQALSALTGNQSAVAGAHMLADSVEFLIYSLYHLKHYEGQIERLGNKSYRFYDEREWRFLPEFKCAVCELKMTEDDYKKWRGTGPKPLLSQVCMDFTFDDIDHIIVETRQDVVDLVGYLNSLPATKFASLPKELMFTRILCYDDIVTNY